MALLQCRRMQTLRPSALESLAGASQHSSRCKADLRLALHLNLEPHAPLR